MDKYHTTCAKCEETISFKGSYKENGKWYCGRCFRQLDPEYYDRHHDDRYSKGQRGERSDD